MSRIGRSPRALAWQCASVIYGVGLFPLFLLLMLVHPAAADRLADGLTYLSRKAAFAMMDDLRSKWTRVR